MNRWCSFLFVHPSNPPVIWFGSGMCLSQCPNVPSPFIFSLYRFVPIGYRPLMSPSLEENTFLFHTRHVQILFVWCPCPCPWLLLFFPWIFLTLCNFCSAISHIRECFCPWTSFCIWLGILSLDFMSNLYSQLGYPTGELQALHLIVLVAFGVVNKPPVCWSTCRKITVKPLV